MTEVCVSGCQHAQPHQYMRRADGKEMHTLPTQRLQNSSCITTKGRSICVSQLQRRVVAWWPGLAAADGAGGCTEVIQVVTPRLDPEEGLLPSLHSTHTVPMPFMATRHRVHSAAAAAAHRSSPGHCSTSACMPPGSRVAVLLAPLTRHSAAATNLRAALQLQVQHALAPVPAALLLQVIQNLGRPPHHG